MNDLFHFNNPSRRLTLSDKLCSIIQKKSLVITRYDQLDMQCGLILSTLVINNCKIYVFHIRYWIAFMPQRHTSLVNIVNAKYIWRCLKWHMRVLIIYLKLFASDSLIKVQVCIPDWEIGDQKLKLLIKISIHNTSLAKSKVNAIINYISLDNQTTSFINIK